MKTIKSLHHSLLFELQKGKRAEKQLSIALPHLLKHVQSPLVKREFKTYLKHSEDRRNKLRWAFEYLDKNKSVPRSRAGDCTIEELDEIISITHAGKVRDLLLLNSLRKVVAWKIALLENCKALAHELRVHEVEEILAPLIEHERHAATTFFEMVNLEANEEEFIEMT